MWGRNCRDAAAEEPISAAARPLPHQGMHNQQGFSMTELLVAIALMTIGLFAVLSMITTATNANTLAHQMSVATNLGQQAMEDILSWEYTNTKFTTATGAYTYGTTTIPGAGTYTINYRTAAGTGALAGNTQVDVTVTYRGKRGTATGTMFDRSVTYTSYKRIPP